MKSAAQLAMMPDDGNRYELIEGELTLMSPAGGRHGRIAVRFNKLLAIHVDDNALGATFAAETGFLISTNPDTVRAPDGAFVEQTQMDRLADDTGFLPFAPDLAAEVVSPNDSFAFVEKKAFAWLEAGCKIVVILEPESQTVHTYRSRSQISVYCEDEIVNVDDVVKGWAFSVNDIFV